MPRFKHILFFSLMLVLVSLPLLTSAAVFQNPLPPNYGFYDLIARTTLFLLGLSGFLALLALVYGGILLIAGGMHNEQDIVRGKQIIFWAIAGLMVIASSAVILRTIKSVLLV